MSNTQTIGKEKNSHPVKSVQVILEWVENISKVKILTITL